MLNSLFWKPYSHLVIVGDNAGWAVDEDAKDLKKLADQLGIEAHIAKRVYLNISQTIHYTSQFSLMLPIYHSRNRISVDYYHGRPGRDENVRSSFTKCFEALKSHHENIARVRVSTKDMETLITSSGIDPDKVMRIPIGVDTNLFTPQTKVKKKEVRNKLGIPQDAVVIGSFLKDGVGLGEGNEPKLIKGPDIFIKVIEKLYKDIPNLFILLSGPARGYVKNSIEAIGVPYVHQFLDNTSMLPAFYDAIDLYIITSREEGGPKACLESMAKGVPLVTTEVGQCKDLVRNGKNALMAPIDDVDGLYKAALEVVSNPALRESLIQKSLDTADDNSHESQLPLWREYLKPLID